MCVDSGKTWRVREAVEVSRVWPSMLSGRSHPYCSILSHHPAPRFTSVHVLYLASYLSPYSGGNLEAESEVAGCLLGAEGRPRRHHRAPPPLAPMGRRSPQRRASAMCGHVWGSLSTVGNGSNKPQQGHHVRREKSYSYVSESRMR